MIRMYTHEEVESAMIAADRAAIADVIHLLRRIAQLAARTPEESESLRLMAEAIEELPRGLEDIKRAIVRWIGIYPLGVLLFILVLASPAMAQQSYDFTLSGSAITAGGVFTTSTQLQSYSTMQGSGSGYAITSLAGTFNGAAMSLASPPGGLGNIYMQGSLPIQWFAPLWFSTSGTIGKYSLQQSGPVEGQWITDPHGYVTYVQFTVKPAPQFSSHPILSSNSNVPVSFAKPTSYKRSLQPVTIEISVPASIALGVAIYEWHHHRTHRDAYPAGRF